MDFSHFAVLTLNGELTDVNIEGNHSCLVQSAEPLTLKLLERIQLRIEAVTSCREKTEPASKSDFDIICQVLDGFGVHVVDVADIWFPRPGHVWVNPMGENYHQTKLRRLVMGIKKCAAK